MLLASTIGLLFQQISKQCTLPKLLGKINAGLNKWSSKHNKTQRIDQLLIFRRSLQRRDCLPEAPNHNVPQLPWLLLLLLLLYKLPPLLLLKTRMLRPVLDPTPEAK